jgi:hypothetical protein
LSLPQHPSHDGGAIDGSRRKDGRLELKYFFHYPAPVIDVACVGHLPFLFVISLAA